MVRHSNSGLLHFTIPMKHTFSILLVFAVAGQMRATGHFEFTAEVRQAYEQVTSLRFTEAKATLAQIQLKDPNNLIVYHIENYIDFLTLYLNPNKNDFQRLKKNQEIRLAKIASGDATSPYYLYAQADVRMQWALVKFRFDEWLSGFGDVNKACRLLHRNQEKFPDFLPNQKDLGVIHALAGYIPENYKWAVHTFTCLSGTLEEGKRELRSVLEHGQQHDFIFQAETAVMYATILLYIDNDGEAAWQTLQQVKLQPATNPLHCFVMANVAMRAGRNNRAIELLNQYPRSKNFLPVGQIDFMLGIAKLRRLDADAAPYFRTFLSDQAGQTNRQAAYQKLAWIELLQNNTNGYKKYMQLILKEGKGKTGGDQDAQKEAEASTIADPHLVRARLLFDGGYFQKAYEQFANKTANSFKHTLHQLEYMYRLGRILHGLKRYDEAIVQYRRTIEQGRNEPYYFACNAALQMGNIYETLGKTAAAKDAYHTCLGIQPEEYKNDLHQKAKAGLARLK